MDIQTCPLKFGSRMLYPYIYMHVIHPSNYLPIKHSISQTFIRPIIHTHAHKRERWTHTHKQSHSHQSTDPFQTNKQLTQPSIRTSIDASIKPSSINLSHT